MPIMQNPNATGTIVELGHGDVYIAVGEDTDHAANSIVFIHHDKPHTIGECHRELEGLPINGFDNTVVLHFQPNALHTIDILIECLVTLRNRMKGINDKIPMEEQLLHILMNHCGERGCSEGAVETLQRIIDERNRALLGMPPIIRHAGSPVSNG